MNCGHTLCQKAGCLHCFPVLSGLGQLLRQKPDETSGRTLVRAFDTGATRSADTGRYDPEGFLSPIVIERFSEYMNKHRAQPDGSIRDSDNWQKGIPKTAYAKGLWRHVLHFWTRHRGFKVMDKDATADMQEDLCSIIFNAQGYLHEILKDTRR